MLKDKDGVTDKERLARVLHATTPLFPTLDNEQEYVEFIADSLMELLSIAQKVKHPDIDNDNVASIIAATYALHISRVKATTKLNWIEASELAKKQLKSLAD